MDQSRPGDRSDAGSAPAAGEALIDWPEALARHGGWLRRVISTRLGERQAVEDVMQEVCLAAVGKPPPAVGASAVAAWLYRVAVRQCLLYRRRSGRRRRLAERFNDRARGAAPRPLSGGADPDGPLPWLLAAERRELVARALARLPRRDADVLALKYGENWSYRELAERLGTTEAAVESRLHRARRRLREELARLTRDGEPP